ncbi:MAG: hypothetical protein JWM82_899 [Myxococcales bacterium]|nr:hypothetical protein [Myxococcales bacterium]
MLVAPRRLTLATKKKSKAAAKSRKSTKRPDARRSGSDAGLPPDNHEVTGDKDVIVPLLAAIIAGGAKSTWSKAGRGPTAALRAAISDAGFDPDVDLETLKTLRFGKPPSELTLAVVFTTDPEGARLTLIAAKDKIIAKVADGWS